MMKNIFRALLLFVSCLMLACTDLDELFSGDDVHSAILRFEGSIEGYDVKTRATTSVWPDGARIYIQYQTADGVTNGSAVYSSKSDTWTVTYSGTLTQGKAMSCSVYYFEDPSSMTATYAILNAHSASYADAEASYFFEDGTMTIHGILKPLLGRIRFKGTAGTSFTLSGLKWYTGYSNASNSLSQQSGTLSLTVGSNGFTPYVYAQFADASARKLTIVNGEDEFTKAFSSNVLAVKSSGYVNVPTASSRQGWTLKEEGNNRITIPVNGVSFNMIKVEAGSFQMGGDGEYDGKPVHQVTLTNDYYIGETEVTQELWTAVMGSNPSHFTSSNQLPVEMVSWDDCQTFITKLNALTGRTFRLPSEAEWEFAARGGNASEGYTYSGSNTIGDVAWYWDNIPSRSSGKTGYGTQPVATKAPNELGIYDMSGNVWEWCQDRYGSYSSDAQTNPTGSPSYYNRVSRGGSWSYDGSKCRVAGRNDNAPPVRLSDYGLRLALEDDNRITITANGVSFNMIKVEGGTFQMGGNGEGDDEYYGRPIHQVTLTNDYYIGETEVTQELWTAVMGSNPSYFTSSNRLPVEKVSWKDCQTFITKLNELTGKTFRLPTEAEWEFAARGGNAS